MTKENKDPQNVHKDSIKPVAKTVEDLEGLSDEELDGISGGNCISQKCLDGGVCARCSGGGGCGSNAGQTNEANIISNPGDVELDPTRKR